MLTPREAVDRKRELEEQLTDLLRELEETRALVRTYDRIKG